MPLASVAEPQVRFFSPMPKDYQFVPKGDVYVTSNVRKRTHAVGATLYVVIDKHKKPIGLRCPTSIFQEVETAAQASSASRAAVVQNRDAAVEREFETALLRAYPKIPRKDTAKILNQALEKRSRRVGRTRALDLESKVQLAVKAYIRHCHTRYEQLLKSGIERARARRLVMERSREVAVSWMGRHANEAIMDAEGGQPKWKRKTPSGRPRRRKTRATTCVSRSPVRPASRTDNSIGNIEDENSAEEKDSEYLSVFDDDPDDSDWSP